MSIENNDQPKSLDDQKYQNADLGQTPNLPQEQTPQNEKEMQKIRERLDSLKNFITSKFKFVQAIGIIPPQAAEIFDDENELSDEEKKEKPMHIVVILPTDKEKEFNNVKIEIIKKIKESKQKIWLNLFLENDLWEVAMDSKYNVIEAIGMSYPLFDKGILGTLRVAQIHKSLVLRKFEKYVYSYVIGGSAIYKGGSTKTSEVDTYVIIDDTDVKRMPRLELKEKLRNIIYSYVMQAIDMAGVKNDLHVQVYLLTEFWDGVKDANPVFYTFIRDGVPLYDRGGFLPWKLLLRMGKIKPSPEAIDSFMSVGEKTQEVAKRKLLDIVVGDIFYGVSMPTQGLLMLYGLPPTNVYETVSEFKRIFVDKEKLVEKKYYDILEEIMIKYYKGFEHEKIKTVTGKEVDHLMKNSEIYLNKLKELRKEVEKRMMKKTFEEIYSNVFNIMESLFGKKSESSLIKDFQKEILNKGLGNPRHRHTLNELASMKKKYKTNKTPNLLEFETLRKETVYLINDLVEFGQRKELGLLEKTKVVITTKGKSLELYLTNPSFLVDGNSYKKIEGGKLMDSDMNEMNNVLSKYKGKRVKIDGEVLKALKKELGEFDISL